MQGRRIMLQRQIQRKQKSFALQRGLYVVRYDAAADPANPPLVTLTCAPGINEVILPPDQSTPSMSAPGQALVIRANEKGHVQVEISSTAHATTLDATLKFEQLRGDTSGGVGDTASLAPPPIRGRTAPRMQQPAGASPPPAIGPTYASSSINQPAEAARSAPTGRPGELQVLGHVARLGDVTVGADQWLGGPAAPTRIEGFLLRWPGKPADVELRYAATVAGQRPGEIGFVELGEFAGTRGRGRPILGYMIELSGPGARNWSIATEALFLGSPARRSAGQSVAGSGPTGREPLVGLRIAVTSRANVERPPLLEQTAARSAGDPPAAPPGSRIRVFRA
jgi:hypothetical protein